MSKNARDMDREPLITNSGRTFVALSLVLAAWAIWRSADDRARSLDRDRYSAKEADASPRASFWADALMYATIAVVLVGGLAAFSTGVMNMVTHASYHDVYVDGVGEVNGIDFPATAQEDYVFSVEPYGNDKPLLLFSSERWLQERFPELWDEGVRALTSTRMPPTEAGDPETAGVLVQYLDGVRYEGTVEAPLGLRGQDPTVIPSDAVQANLARFADVPDLSGNIGQGGYAAELHSSGGQVTVQVIRPTWAASAQVLSTIQAPSEPAAIAYLLSGPVSLGDRTLLPGELGSITWFEDNGDGTATVRVWDQQAEQWLEAGVTAS